MSIDSSFEGGCIMREKLRDWKRDWIEANGETDDIEVLISEGDDTFKPYIYEGSFKDIPEELLDRKVINFGQIMDSSVPERVGAYSLTI